LKKPISRNAINSFSGHQTILRDLNGQTFKNFSYGGIIKNPNLKILDMKDNKLAQKTPGAKASASLIV
jgi:hypothetical protein